MVRDAVLRTAPHHEVGMWVEATAQALILRSPPKAGVSKDGHESKLPRTPALIPLHAVTRQHLAHRLDELVLRYRELRLGLLLQIFVAVLGLVERGAEDQILDLHLALLLLV